MFENTCTCLVKLYIFGKAGCPQPANFSKGINFITAIFQLFSLLLVAPASK